MITTKAKIMSDTLFNIPIVPWVQKTINKMDKNKEESRDKWNDYWYESYKELADEIKIKITTSGTKTCPIYGTYGLWYLGYIVDSGRNFQKWEINDIISKDISNNKKIGRKKKLGKNVLYAVLALNILQECQGNINYDHLWIDDNLWKEVQKHYLQLFPGGRTAEKDQGEVQIAMQLFKAKLIIIQ